MGPLFEEVVILKRGPRTGRRKKSYRKKDAVTVKRQDKSISIDINQMQYSCSFKRIH